MPYDPYNSAWLDDLRAQLDAVNTDGYGAAPAPAAPMGSTSGLSVQAPSTGYWDRAASNMQAGGGLTSLLTSAYDPEAGAGNSTTATGLAVLGGILKSVGRGLGSAYGNPGFGLAARRVDQEGELGRERLAQYQQETQAALQQDAEKRARAAAISRAMSGLDPSNLRDNEEAVARAVALGEYEVAAKIKSLYREPEKPQPPASRRRPDGNTEVFEEFNPETGRFEPVSSAPRWQARGTGRASGGGGAADAGSPGLEMGPDGMPVDAWQTPPLRAEDKQANTAARTMGKSLEADSKDFVTLQTSQRQLDELEKANSPAAEIATLYSFIKQLDPGSVVREGEVSLSTQGMSYFDRLGLAYKRVGEGGVVTPEMKKDLIATARKLYRASLPAQIDREKRAFNVGAQLRVPPSALGGSRLTQSDWDTAYGKDQAPAAAPAGDTKVVNGVTYIRANGGWKRQ